MFSEGESSKKIWVPIEFDREDEDTETMTLVLCGTEVERGGATGSIVDYSGQATDVSIDVKRLFRVLGRASG